MQTTLWEETVEALSVSLSKHHCAVLHLPAADVAEIDVAVAAFQSLFSTADWSAPAADTPGQTCGLAPAIGCQRFDVRIGAESLARLPERNRIAAHEVSGCLPSCICCMKAVQQATS